MVDETDFESTVLEYNRGKGVSSLISLDIEVERSDEIAERLSEFDNIEDVFLLTGDVDLMLKARFEDYEHMKVFLTQEINRIKGIKDANSMMIVSAYKEKNEVLVEED